MVDAEYKLEKNIKIAMLYLEDDDAINAETFIKKAASLITGTKVLHLLNREISLTSMPTVPGKELPSSERPIMSEDSHPGGINDEVTTPLYLSGLLGCCNPLQPPAPFPPILHLLKVIASCTAAPPLHGVGKTRVALWPS